MTQIEKIARLMGYSVAERKEEFNYYHIDADTVGTFDPLTNKADLMDVECALSVWLEWYPDRIRAMTYEDTFNTEKTIYFIWHNNDEFTARAHAVLAVAEQIYDHRTEGK